MSTKLSLGIVPSFVRHVPPRPPLRARFFTPSFPSSSSSSSSSLYSSCVSFYRGVSSSSSSSASPSTSGPASVSVSAFSPFAPRPRLPFARRSTEIESPLRSSILGALSPFSRPTSNSTSNVGPGSSAATKRAFSSSGGSWIRQTYFPRGSGSGGGGGGGGRGGGGWFRNFRDRIDAIPPTFIVYGLIGANIAIFLLWQYAVQSWQRFRDPALYQWLTKNFTLNEYNIMAGRIWTLLTASFSHMGGSHILVNCLGLYLTGPVVASLIGSSAFLGLYLGGGIFASVTSYLWHKARGDRWAGSVGASGAVYSSLAFYGALFPQTTFYLFMIVPMPAWVLIGGIFAYDGYSAIFRPNSGTDSAGHVGGVLFGLVGALLLKRRGGLGRFRRW